MADREFTVFRRVFFRLSVTADCVLGVVLPFTAAHPFPFSAGALEQQATIRGDLESFGDRTSCSTDGSSHFDFAIG